jgi:AcrR family transcriptional regulator
MPERAKALSGFLGGSMSAKARREKEKEARRKQILDAARSVLFEKGMDEASMNQIAEAAELSVGTLYLYFENKEELFAALQEEGLNLLHDNIESAKKVGGPPDEMLRRMALAYLEFSKSHRNYFNIMNYFLAAPEVSFSAPIKMRIDLHGEKILSQVESVLVLIGEGSKANEQTLRQCAVVFWSTLHGLIQFRKLSETILSGSTFDKQFLFNFDCILTGLVAKLSTSMPNN